MEVTERKLSSEERDRIIHELRYDLWNDYFFDAPLKEIREYPKDDTYIIAQFGSVKRPIKKNGIETGDKVYYIHPIKLFPFFSNQRINTLQNLPVTAFIKKEKNKEQEKNREGDIIFCRIKYREEKYLNTESDNYTEYDYYETVSFYSAFNIIETPYTYADLLEISNKVVPKYLRRLEEEARMYSEKAAAIEKEKAEYFWLCDNYEKLTSMLKAGKDISLEEVEKENAELVEELKTLAENSALQKKQKETIRNSEEAIKNRKEKLSAQEKVLNELKRKIKSKNEEVLPQITELYKKAGTDQKRILTQNKNKYESIVRESDALDKQYDEKLKNINKKNHSIIDLERLQRSRQIENNRLSTEVSGLERKRDSLIREKEDVQKDFEEKNNELEQEKNKLNEILKENRNINEEKQSEIKRCEEEYCQMIADYKDYISKQKGEYIQFLKKYTDALSRVEKEEIEEINQFLEQNDFSEKVHEELVERIVGFLWNRGQYYKDANRTVTRFVSAVGSGQIILLCGAPGSGKSSFPKFIGDATGAEVREIIVQPNWTDSQDILGYYNSNDKSYVHTPFLDALIDAEKDEEKGKQYFIVLDEMNLAHVEYYFSTILSAMELDGRLSVISRTELDELEQIDKEECEILRNIRIPENVQFIGTLNIDEISKNISPKVIDRSVIIELTSETDENQIKETVYAPDSLQPVKNTWRIYKYPPDKIGLEKDKNDGIDPEEETITQVEAVYKAVDDFYNAYKQRIYGSPVILSARCRKRIEYMAKRGANTEDIILGRLLPCVNWEMTETVFDVFKERILGENEDSDFNLPDDVKKSIGKKLDAMKDYSNGSIILDYWLSSRR